MKLSPREAQLLQLLLLRLTRAERALTLGMAESSVRNLQKLLAWRIGVEGTCTREAILARAVARGIITDVGAPAGAGASVMPPYITVLTWDVQTKTLTIEEPFCTKCGEAYSALTYPIFARYPLSIEDGRVTLGAVQHGEFHFPPLDVRNMVLLCPGGHERKALIRGPRATLEERGRS